MPEEHHLVAWHSGDSKLSLTSENTSGWPTSPSSSSETFAGLRVPPSPYASTATLVPNKSLNQPNFHPSNAPSSRRSRAHLTPWKFEIFSSVVSILSMLGLVILLLHFDGQVYREWPFHLTLNGVVAICSTICHTALLVPVGGAISQAAWLYYLPDKERRTKDLEHIETFNDASRGAFGSLKLLWQLRGRNLVAMGAVLMVLSLVFDTFTQQVLSLESRSTASTGADSLKYHAGQVPRRSYVMDYDHGSTFSEFTPTPSTKSAIYNGILSQDIHPPTVPCSTGNCTWPIVPSLAVCGECSPSSFTTACNATYCNYTMPTGTIFTSPIQVRTSDTLFTVVSSKGDIYNYSSASTAYIGVFDAIGAPWQSWYVDNTSMIATECGLWMCVQAYNISSSNSVQSHETIANWSQIVPTTGSTGVVLPLIYASVTENRTFVTPPDSMNPLPGNYSVYGLSIVAMTRSLSDAIPGTVFGGIGTKSYSTAFLESIWNNTSAGNLDPWIKRLALSMTNNIRTSSSSLPAIPAYDGVTYYSQHFIVVRWVWLSLPVLLVVSSVVFLAASIVRTARAGVEVFKGSPLALLFCDIEASLTAGGKRSSTMQIGVKKVDRMRVVLREKGGKWLFREE